MWQEIDSVVPEVSVLRRLLFATAHLSKECPKYWNTVTKFSFGCSDKVEDVKVLVENLEFLDNKAFETDKELLKELHSAEGYHNQPLGIVLVSPKTVCKLCGGKLLVRADRPSVMTVYTDDMGTVNGTHFRKYCQNSRKQCHFTQYYAFHKNGESGKIIFDHDWDQHQYLISSSKTAFSISFLRRFEAELLLGQVSFNQKSAIYNFYNHYEQVMKKTSTDAGATSASVSKEDTSGFG